MRLDESESYALLSGVTQPQLSGTAWGLDVYSRQILDSEAAPIDQARVSSPLANPDSKKALGAYYTDERIARFLSRWAIVSGRETVLEPSFGAGIFLNAAAERLDALEGDHGRQVFGVDVDEAACLALTSKLAEGRPAARVLHRSFFDVDVDELPAIDVVVGNPPFIRYHRFRGDARKAGLRCARRAGVILSQLTSSWAPFLVHAACFVAPNGRLAMVVPAEILHAGYARPVLAYLARSFRLIRILTFSRRLFPGLSEDTVLLLAAGKGDRATSFSLLSLPDVVALANYQNPELELPPGIGIGELAHGRPQRRAAEYLLEEPIRELYRRLGQLPQIHALGELADVGIGYVSGDNGFFHLDNEAVLSLGIPTSYLRRAVRRGSDLRGLCFRNDDWQALHDAGDANLLLDIPDDGDLPDPVQAYLGEGVRARVPDRYKCRVRRPWYSVPHVYEGDALLTYMSGSAPRLVANGAHVVSPNTLLVVRIHALTRGFGLSARDLALAWQTSLTALSCEIEGHSLGGGMLKLEPSEAGRVAIALPRLDPAAAHALFSEVDGLLRLGKPDLAQERCDSTILCEGLGLSVDDVQKLREGWTMLRSRRLSR
ncbi:MAG: N-6 DNA methylase [Chloroflexota bacterium]